MRKANTVARMAVSKFTPYLSNLGRIYESAARTEETVTVISLKVQHYALIGSERPSMGVMIVNPVPMDFCFIEMTGELEQPAGVFKV